MAQATKSSGGKVFVQVLSGIEKKLKPSQVSLPSHLVDGVILCRDPENDHRQTNKYKINEGLTNSISHEKIPDGNDVIFKKIIAQRALLELKSAKMVNLGQGLPELVGVYAKQDSKQYGHILTHLESGVIGGVPERRPDFGAAMSPTSFLTQDNQFASFNGGQLDAAILSFAQIDKVGDVNVSRIGSEEFGGGGFMDIVQSTKKLIFVGAFTAKGLTVDLNKNILSIVNEGSIQKFVDSISQITYTSQLQKKKSQVIKIITERCVFEVFNRELTLIEVSKGIDIKKDIIGQMGFEPNISPELKKNLN